MSRARWQSVLSAVVLVGLVAGSAASCGDAGPDEATAPAASVSERSSTPPRANVDHWHASFDVYACDAFLGPFYDAGPDIAGIHTHGDGLVHIHPFEERAAGARATFSVFAEQLGIVVDDGTMAVPEQIDPRDELVAPDSAREPVMTTWNDGDACPTGPGRVALFVWPADAADDAAPTQVVTTDIGATRFSEDGQRFVLAFVPEGVVPPQPPATPDLAAPSDME